MGLTLSSERNWSVRHIRSRKCLKLTYFFWTLLAVVVSKSPPRNLDYPQDSSILLPSTTASTRSHFLLLCGSLVEPPTLIVSRRLLGAYRKISGWRSSWYHLQLGVHNHHLHGMESNSHGHAYSTLLHARLDFFAATLVCLLSIFLHSLVASLFFLSGFQKRKVPAFFLFIQAKEKRSYRTYCFLMFLLDWN